MTESSPNAAQHSPAVRDTLPPTSAGTMHFAARTMCGRAQASRIQVTPAEFPAHDPEARWQAEFEDPKAVFRQSRWASQPI